MRNLLKVVCCSVILLSSIAVANPWITYKTSGTSRYLNGEIEISSWANALLMRGLLMDRGRTFELQATLEPSSSGSYRGSGYILVQYEDGTGCRHRFGSEIRFVNNHIYLRENIPATIPFDPNGPCIPAGPYEWYLYPEPYMAQ